MILVDLNATDDRPIYGQIADRVKFAVAAGVVRPGELIPSVRELSKQLVVNPNTVAPIGTYKRKVCLNQSEGWVYRSLRAHLIFAEQLAVRLFACDYVKQLMMPDRAGWTRLRSRTFCAKSGLREARKPTVIFGSQSMTKNHGDPRGEAQYG